MLAPDDLTHFDGLEAVTLLPAGIGTEVAIGKALRRRPSRRELEASGGKYLAEDVRWHLPAAALSSPPLPGARIVDAAGEHWTVLAVDREALGSRWACWSRNLAVAGGLEEVVAIETAVWSKDEHGAPLAAWSVYRTAVRARVQPVESAEQSADDQRRTPRRYRAFVAEPLPLDADLRIVRDGRAYRVLGYRRPERIDELLVLDVEDCEV